MYSKYSNIDEWYKDNPDPRKSEEQAAIKYFKQLKAKNDETRKLKYFNYVVALLSDKDKVFVVGKNEYYTHFKVNIEEKTISAEGLYIYTYGDTSVSIYAKYQTFTENEFGRLIQHTITKDELKSILSNAYKTIKKFI